MEMDLKKINMIKNLYKNSNYIKAKKIADKYIKENKTINALKVNKVLKFQGIKINQKLLDKVLTKPKL